MKVRGAMSGREHEIPRLAVPQYVISARYRPDGGPGETIYGVRSYWYDNAVAEARHLARINGLPGAWISHPHTDRQAFVRVDGTSTDNMSYFDPCQCGCGLVTCETARR